MTHGESIEPLLACVRDLQVVFGIDASSPRMESLMYGITAGFWHLLMIIRRSSDDSNR